MASREADYDIVPAHLKDRVCGCGGRHGATNPINWSRHYVRSDYTLPFNWWVCSNCLKPAPMNALNARLIQECEMCEDAYFVSHYPDKMGICDACK